MGTIKRTAYLNLLTLDTDPNSTYNGIKKMNVIDWLLK